MTIGESVHIRDQGRQRNVQGRTQDPQFYLNETAIAPFIPGHQATLPSSVNIQPVDDSKEIQQLHFILPVISQKQPVGGESALIQTCSERTVRPPHWF